MSADNKDLREKFSVAHLPSLLSEAFKAWINDDPWRLSAVVAYYAVLALPGLLVIVISSMGYLWSPEVVQSKLMVEVAAALGQDVADSIMSIMQNVRQNEKSTLATLIGVATLIFGATGVFYHLQLSINKVWQIKQNPDVLWKRVVKDRAIGFAFVLIIGFLLLTSFIISTVISIFHDYLSSQIPYSIYWITYLANSLITFLIIAFLFALIFKYLPDAKIKWKYVWVGGLITSLLFSLGKFGLSTYFSSSNPASPYGAAGSVVLVLLWVSYSCLILFYGAEFTWVFARRYGYEIKPQAHAMIVEEREVILEKGED